MAKKKHYEYDGMNNTVGEYRETDESRAKKIRLKPTDKWRRSVNDERNFIGDSDYDYEEEWTG
jgi:hypothetical protein